MNTLKHQYMNACARCGHERATVTTKSEKEDRFYDGDAVTCEFCGNTGEIETSDDDCAHCLWHGE